MQSFMYKHVKKKKNHTIDLYLWLSIFCTKIKAQQSV